MNREQTTEQVAEQVVEQVAEQVAEQDYNTRIKGKGVDMKNEKLCASEYFNLFTNAFVATLDNKKLVLDVFDDVFTNDENYFLICNWFKKILPEKWRFYSNTYHDYDFYFGDDDVIQKKVTINYCNLEDVKKILIEKYNVNEEKIKEVDNKNQYATGAKLNSIFDDYFNSVAENNYSSEYFRSVGSVKYVEVPIFDFLESFENIFDVNTEKIKNILKNRIDAKDKNVMKILRKFFNEKFHYFNFKDENAQENFVSELSEKTYSIAHDVLLHILTETNALEPIEEILFFDGKNKINLLKDLDKTIDELKATLENVENVAKIVYTKYFNI